MLSTAYRQDLNWLVTEFTTRVEDVAHAIVVSADGVPLALSAGIPADSASGTPSADTTIACATSSTRVVNSVTSQFRSWRKAVLST